MFVGRDRHSQVSRLSQLFEEARASRTPQMIVFVAPPGWGKTRIVQEFYRELATCQQFPAYWPSALEPDPRTARSGFIALTAARKAVRHRDMEMTAGATIPWLWLAPPTGRISDGSPAPTLDGLSAQLVEHLPSLIERLDKAGVLTPETYQSIASALTLPEVTNFVMTMGEAGEALLDAAVAERRRSLRANQDGHHRATKLLQLLGTVARAGDDVLPTVIVLDDGHDMDEETVAFIAEVLAAESPVLILATTWPDRVGPDSPVSPFQTYLAECANGDRLTRVVLGRLHEDDLTEYVLSRYPQTDPQVAVLLARRADGNPYALRLLLNTPRLMAAVRGRKLDLAPAEIDELNGGLDRLLSEHWAQLPLGVQQILVAAALLGQSFHEDVLEECLREIVPQAGLDEAIASAWIQPVGGPRGLIEFIEHMRYEIAHAAVPNVLSQAERDQVQISALYAVKNCLRDNSLTDNRQGLLALHLALAEAGIETDLTAAACSAAELSEQARVEYRRADAIRYLRLAIRWTEAAPKPDWAALAGYYLELASTISVEAHRHDAIPEAQQCLAIADSHLDAEWQIRARCCVARTHRDDYVSGGDEVADQTLEQATRLAADLGDIEPETRWQLMSAQYRMAGTRGKPAESLAILMDLAGFCDEQFGTFDRRSLSCLESLGYFGIRAGDLDLATRARRSVLTRRIEQIGVAGYMQTAPARSNLAFTLLRLNDDAMLPEVEQLITEAVTMWSRGFGLDGARTQRGRLIRASLWQRQGLAAEAQGEAEHAREKFERAEAETARILSLRENARPASYATVLVRHGASRACLRERDALTFIGKAINIRRTDLRQDDTYWEMRDCAKALCWAYERLGRRTEAERVRLRYKLDRSVTAAIHSLS
jgi:hypothetical protein